MHADGPALVHQFAHSSVSLLLEQGPVQKVPLLLHTHGQLDGSHWTQCPLGSGILGLMGYFEPPLVEFCECPCIKDCPIYSWSKNKVNT